MPEARNFAGEPLEHWISRLPLPVGIFCVNDHMGHVVADACQVCRIAVPRDAILLGVDNHAVLCNASFPSLSSIEQPLDRIAREAIEMLDQVMSGQNQCPRSKWLAPTQVITRQSSEYAAAGDMLVQRALDYIARTARHEMTVNDVVRHVPVCRSMLERRFRENLGTTVLTEINRARIQHVKKLLIDTDWTVDQIARESGFANGGSLSRLFRRITGRQPVAYRREAAG